MSTEKRLGLMALSIALFIYLAVGSAIYLAIPSANQDKADSASQASTEPNLLPKNQNPTPGSPVATMSALALYDEYKKNALGADAAYKGKWVRVSGRVEKIEAGDSGRYVLGFGIFANIGLPVATVERMSPQQKKWFSEGYPPNVLCYIAPVAQKQFSGVKRDDKIDIIGRSAGMKNDSSVFSGLVVILEECFLRDP